MSGPGGSPDELDQALALANDVPTGAAPAGGACADCPARRGPAGGGTGSTAAGGAGDPANDGRADDGRADDDLAAPWLSAASPSTEGLRGTASPGRPAPVEDDLAPAWLLGSADRDAEVSPGEGRLSGMMRALRRPASGDGSADRDAPADDGLLPDWFTRAARRVGLNRSDTPETGPDTDPDDALAAPWVPRLPTRPTGHRPDPVAPATPVPGEASPPPTPAAGPAPTSTGPAAGAAPGDATGDPADPVADGAGARAPGPDPARGPGSAPPADPGRGGAGDHESAGAVDTSTAARQGGEPGGQGVSVADGASPGDTAWADSVSGTRNAASGGSGRGGGGAEPGRPPLPTGAGPSAERACSHPCGHEVRAEGAVASGGVGSLGGPGRGGAPGERHDGRVTTHRAAAGAGSGTPVDVSEASAPAGQPGREPARPAAPPPAHVTWDEAQRIAARAAAPAAAVTVPLERAARQVLAAPVEALADLPSFDTAAMDGWAVAGPGPWVPAGPPEGTGVLAGQATPPAPLADGCAVRIATGARMPDGATAVLRSERAELRDGRLRLAAGAPPHSDGHGTDVRPRGQECRTGDRLLPAGTPVTPPVLGLAAAAGYDRLTVTPRPRAEVLVLGDELLHSGLPSGGRIRDALGPMVGPWLTALGAEVLVTRRLGDDAEALHEAVTTTTADLLVTTGGTAHGPVDHVRPTLHRIGAQLLVDGVEVRPGHPMLLAALAGGQRGRHLVGLPGNPLAAVSGLLTLAAPLLRARAGLPEPEPVRATLTAEVQGHPRDTRLVPVTRSADGSGATPLRWTGPAMLRGIAGASALAAVPPGGAAAGTSVRLLELPW